MRLIDADNIKFEEDCTFSGKGLNEFIKAIPTAYDVGKVVERLELLSENEEYNDLNTYEEKAVYNTAYLEAIKTVKAGGVDG